MGHPRGLSERTRGAVTGARDWAHAQRENHVLVDLLVDLFKRFKAADGTVLAGYLAYRLFLMLIPLAAIVVAVAGFARAESVDAANHMNLGGAMVDGLSQASADVEKSRLPLLLSGVAGFLVASWGLLGGFR
jgi:uncharacterized BrkB/YihY/UPF0761 family membrane protein